MECDSVSRKSGFEWGWSNCSLAAKPITAPNMAPSCWIYPVLWSLAALSFCIWFGSACVLSLLGTYLGAPSSVAMLSGDLSASVFGPQGAKHLGFSKLKASLVSVYLAAFPIKVDLSRLLGTLALGAATSCTTATLVMVDKCYFSPSPPGAVLL